ncbi:integral membrane protein Srb [Dictyocaulus viviparus]|uniref:Integral membrane protein Srb n=1 Tax=Dictyocaulus viviparus TaxID=29172 RepID=A0A0D8XJH4_DICVI|nr:integral membrane protein Srb [Dictyocaulus viviparus]
MNQISIDLECRKRGLDLVEQPLYRITQIFYVILSMTSIPSLLYVQIKYIYGSPFHQNIKIYGFTSSLITSKPCDYFSPNYIHIPLNICIFVANFGLILIHLALCCERTVATIRFSKYEHNGIVLGLILSALTVVGVLGAIFYVYDIEDFNEKLWSIIILPSASTKRYNKVAFANIIILISSVLLLSYLCKHLYWLSSTALPTSHWRIDSLFFSVHGIVGFFIRSPENRFLHVDHKLYIALRQLFYVIPIFTFVLPIYSVYRLKHYRSNRNDNMRSIVRMESRGAAGCRNYEEIIAKSWELSQHI